MKIRAPVSEPVLASKYFFLPPHPTEAEGASFKQHGRNRRVEATFLVVAEYTRFPVLCPSFRMQIEEGWKQAFGFGHRIAKAETYLISIQTAKDRANLGTESRP